jgi:predicted RNase H-like HicB family nuclease
LIREAIEFHLEGMREHGDAIPVTSATTECITI